LNREVQIKVFFKIRKNSVMLEQMERLGCFSGTAVNRTQLGLSSNWNEILQWVEYKGPIFHIPKIANSSGEVKFTEIPELSDYNGTADDFFWSKFPKTPMSSVAETQINVDVLEEKVTAVSNLLTTSQKGRAEKAINYLRNGAPSHQDSDLNECFVRNSTKTTENGRAVTDNIAIWIQKKYAAGPFDTAPLAGFRVNPLLAVVQPTKVRPVLNVSMPKNLSFNSNIKKEELEK
jgi:hypothetical protein